MYGHRNNTKTSYLGVTMHGGGQEKESSAFAVGIALGVAIGAGLGIALGNPALGIGVGIAMGVGVGLALPRRGSRTMDPTGEDADRHPGSHDNGA
jgi:hypothetical protein